MLIAMFVIGWSYSASGHASAWGDLSLAQLVDSAHIAFTTSWLGGLVVLAVAARPLYLCPEGPERLYAAEMAERLSRLAGLCLVGVVLTGIYNAVTQIAQVSALWETAYGRLLVLKVTVVLGMVGLGALNRFQGLSRLRDWAAHPTATVAPDPSTRASPEGRRFLLIATVEAVLALGVLVCTALLIREAPPRQEATVLGASARAGGAGELGGSP
jgi:putative copper export protein